jgi:hypothetical protein
MTRGEGYRAQRAFGCLSALWSYRVGFPAGDDNAADTILSGWRGLRAQPVCLGIKLTGDTPKFRRDLRREGFKRPQLLRRIAEKPYFLEHNDDGT